MQPCITGAADRLLTGNARMSDFENVPGDMHDYIFMYSSVHDYMYKAIMILNYNILTIFVFVFGAVLFKQQQALVFFVFHNFRSNRVPFHSVYKHRKAG